MKDIVFSITFLRWHWPTFDQYIGAWAIRAGPLHFYWRHKDR